LFDKLEVSIRVTLIVSDEEGYNLVRTMMTPGINFNKTICNVIIKKNSSEASFPEDLEEKAEAFNTKKESKNFFTITTADNDLQKIAMEKVNEALNNVGDYKKARGKANLKKAEAAIKRDGELKA
jgi:hypothetical protein